MLGISGFELEDQRKFLTCLDLLEAMRTFKSASSKIKVVKLIPVLNTLIRPRVLIAGINYYVQARRRRRLRNI
jgi:hypothetical protein